MAGTTTEGHQPAYSIAPDTRHTPIAGLANLGRPADAYVIVGAGKTGIDACLWLLDRGIAPDAISWIMPQDAWLMDRALSQPGDAFFEAVVNGLAAQMEAAAGAVSREDLFSRLELQGALLRLDPGVAPTAYRCASVNLWELEQLRRIKNVVRMGRVKAIEADRIVLERGEITTGPHVLHVDCSAKGVAPRALRPIFEDGRITIQFVRTCQPAFSAAFIAFVEAHYEDEAKKNSLSGVVQSPERAVDWMSMALANAMNAFSWSTEPMLQQWLAQARLNGFSGLHKPSEALKPGQRAARQRLRAATAPAVGNLRRLLA